MKLTSTQKVQLRLYLIRSGELSLPTWLYDYVIKKWAGEIPYSILTGDEGTVEEWVGDHLNGLIKDFKDQFEPNELEAL